jgi:hypothetical protein
MRTYIETGAVTIRRYKQKMMLNGEDESINVGVPDVRRSRFRGKL